MSTIPFPDSSLLSMADHEKEERYGYRILCQNTWYLMEGKIFNLYLAIPFEEIKLRGYFMSTFTHEFNDFDLLIIQLFKK